MAEYNPQEIGRQIANEYLSKRTWAREWRRSIDRQIYPGFQREDIEAKERQCDEIEQDAEDNFSERVEGFRKDTSPNARAVLRAIVDMLGNRTDLGFIGKRIVERLKQELGPF